MQDELNQLPQPLKDKLPKDIFLTIGTENQKQNITAISKTFSAEAFEEALKDQEEDDATAQVNSLSPFSPFLSLRRRYSIGGSLFSSFFGGVRIWPEAQRHTQGRGTGSTLRSRS